MNRKILALMVSLSMFIGICGCKAEENVPETEETTVVTTTEISEATSVETTMSEFDYESIPTFEVTSDNLNDGVWDDIITNTSYGENKSPELSWEKVDGATTYVLYMIDISAGNWIHLKASDITDTSLEMGIFDSKQYVGPYPPSGTHEYVIYVVALRSNPERARGVLDASNSSIEFLFSSLDVNESGEAGNVISYGMLSGTYTAK